MNVKSILLPKVNNLGPGAALGDKAPVVEIEPLQHKKWDEKARRIVYMESKPTDLMAPSLSHHHIQVTSSTKGGSVTD